MDAFLPNRFQGKNATPKGNRFPAACNGTRWIFASGIRSGYFDIIWISNAKERSPSISSSFGMIPNPLCGLGGRRGDPLRGGVKQMWPFTERRRNKRYPVQWHGLLHAYFLDHVETLPCNVNEISYRGARLHLKTLQAGAHHIVADEPEPLYLELMLPAGILTLPLCFSWCDYSAETGIFLLGVQFGQEQRKDRAVLDTTLKSLHTNR